MFTQEELRARAKDYRAQAQSCNDRILQQEYLKLAEACEALAEAQQRLWGKATPSTEAAE